MQLDACVLEHDGHLAHINRIQLQTRKRRAKQPPNKREYDRIYVDDARLQASAEPLKHTIVP